ncbi:MAG: HDOD domain-containing protein, partial [bacterium]|nr:HDOD domain-containing protein [bacterium]
MGREDVVKPANAALIRVDELKSGMSLAEDVKHFNGRLILKKETVLEQRDIRIIKMWGITEAMIERAGDHDGRDDNEPDPGILQKLEPVISDHFRFTKFSHEFNRELYRLSLLHNASPGRAERLIHAHEKQKIPTPYNHTGTVPPEDLKEVIKNTTLPSLPALVIRINEAIGNPNCTATHIAGIISKDSSLSARLLRLVNSPFYSFPTAIVSIARAVSIIGFRQLSMLAVGSVVTATFEKVPPHILHMESFWKHSIACGIIARILSSYKKNTNTETYFLAGLLHDVGRLVIFRNFPEHSAGILSQRAEEPAMMHSLEKKIVGFDHAELGGILVNKWKLPSVFENACRFHHSPLDSPDLVMTSIIHVANNIATAIYFGNSGENYVPPLNIKAWEAIGLPVSVLAPTVAQTADIFKQTV